jgi:hypothetical protein
MTIVLDANVLLRLADPTCAARPTAIEAVRLLLTFNHADFARFSDIEAIDPATLTGKSSN